MKPINIEKLLSHSIGISNSYHRPTENELLEDYLRVVGLLSLDKTSKLQEPLNQFTEINNEETYIIKGKIQEKDEEIKKLNEQFKSLRSILEIMMVDLANISNQNALNTMTKSMFSSGLINKIKNIK
jgi:hypothetical protein